MNAEAFRAELEALINKHSMENGSHTPDSILAKYLAKCLTNFDETVVARDAWYGKRATEIVGVNPGSVLARAAAAGGCGEWEGAGSLSDDEERDWRTFAFAKTREGSVWERASVQRLFATIDKQKAAKAECERQLQEASKKWQDYERDFILPCFRWARELGLDLEQMVRDSPGHNCVELLVSTLRDRFTKIVDLVEKVAQAHDELAERHPNGPDKFKAEALRRFAEVWLSGNVPITSLTELREKGLR